MMIFLLELFSILFLLVAIIVSIVGLIFMAHVMIRDIKEDIENNKRKKAIKKSTLELLRKKDKIIL